MRMRRKKHGDERLYACRAILKEKPITPITSSKEDFGNEKPLHLEIGCGKGGFACGMAEAHPEWNFYAMEKIANVMITAVERAQAEAEARPEDNLRFAVANADALEEWFAPGSVDVIYLNFSDPWPKERHAKRRLTCRAYLEKYFRILKKGGKIRFKTDNVGLFDFTLAQLEEMHLTPDIVTRDLHASEYNEGNIMTEYEKNFSSQGYPIHMLVLTRPEEIQSRAE